MTNPWDLPQTDSGYNPWSGMAPDAAYVQQQQMQGAQNLQGMQQQYQDYSAQTAPYPSFPNAAGAGSQDAFGLSQPNSPASAIPLPTASGPAQESSMGGLRSGGNPWSLSGPALSR